MATCGTVVPDIAPKRRALIRATNRKLTPIGVRGGRASGRHGVLTKFAVILQARYDQVEQAESELRVLEVQFLELIVVDRRRLNVGFTADRHCAPAIGCEQTNLAEQGARSEGSLISTISTSPETI